MTTRQREKKKEDIEGEGRKGERVLGTREVEEEELFRSEDEGKESGGEERSSRVRETVNFITAMSGLPLCVCVCL